jgi:hemolysin D
MNLLDRIRAYGGLFNRYRESFAHFWGLRHALDGPPLRGHEAEFLPAALALQAKPVSPVGRGLAYVMMALVLAVVVWSIVGKVDIVANATGKIIPSGRTKTIASVEVASVRAIHVQEGQTVKAGDLLIELDASATEADHDKAEAEQAEALLQVARAKALVGALATGRPPVMAPVPGVTAEKQRDEQQHLLGQYQDYWAKLRRLDDDIAHYTEALPLAAQQAQDYQALAGTHDVSPHAYLQKEQARLDLEGQLHDARDQREALIAETRKLAFDAITDGEKQASDALQEMRRAGSHNRLLRLLAPVDGTVQQLVVHTIGGVVPAAQPLMQIVPREQSVEVEATLESRDIGFVEEGQTAAIKVNAFEYTKYGALEGHVTHVSRDAIQDEKRGLLYTTTITLSRSTLLVDGREVALMPGMAADVDIKTGTRRVIEYVLSPLMQHGHESLHER